MVTRRINEEENTVKSGVKTILIAILSGIGLGIGFFLVQKATKVK